MSEYCVPARVGEGLFEAKGSRFYARAIPARGDADVQTLFAAMRAEHPEANHHAFAYRLGSRGETARFGDDGEPGGTAGHPIMDVLLHHALVDVAVVVSRHFGGTLLGAGGLVRAYGGAAAQAVRAAGVTTLRPHARLRVTIEYGMLGAVEQEARRLGLRPPQAVYGAEVILDLLVPQAEVEHVRARLSDVTAGRAGLAITGTIFAA